ncbi:cancer-related nucleoside-triphosphatase homolog [Battus philenor]|uniref:cancer-related nucleoside-triphosphatase homolog n=1 Tax=Battus philenor TaxID=42288 RepID=UPI0035CEA1E5
MNQNSIRYFILTGEPGVGKTTLTKKICSVLSNKGIKVVGFYTEEVRNNRVREGFDVVTVEGTRGRLARDQSLLNTPIKFKVGKYGVLVQEFEKVAMPSLTEPSINNSPACIMIDEIGKMEFYSETFKSKIKEIFNSNSKNVVLATIPLRKSDPLIESIRHDKNSKVWLVTKENRNTIHEEIINEMHYILKTQ